MPYAISRDDLEKSGACSNRRKAALAAIKVWPATADDAFAAGVPVDDVLWIAFAVARKRGDAELIRRLRHCMADIATEALPIYEKHTPGDMRVRDCITAIRKFAQGEIGLDDLAAARAAAWDAARDAAWAAASDAARAAARDDARAAQKAIICRWLSDTPPVQAKEEA